MALNYTMALVCKDIKLHSSYSRQRRYANLPLTSRRTLNYALKLVRNDSKLYFTGYHLTWCKKYTWEIGKLHE